MCSQDPACGWAAGFDMDVAAQLMVEHINNGSYVRGGRSLSVAVVDTSCSGGQGRMQAANMLLMPAADRPFAVVGCGCSGCTMNAQPLLNIGRIPMISHSATNPALSVRDTYQNFFRVIPPDASAVQAWFSIMASLKWTTYAQVSEPEYGFALVDYANEVKESYGMVDVLAGNSLSEMRDKTLETAQKLVDVIQASRVKTIMFLGYETYLRFLVCELATRSMFDTNLIFLGWLEPGWWLSDIPATCNAEQMSRMVDKSISANFPAWGPRSSMAECLLPSSTVGGFADEYVRRINAAGTIVRTEASYAADAVCFTAKVFNAMLDEGFTDDDLYNMNDNVYKAYAAKVQSMTMIGTSGPVSFPDGDPLKYAAGDRSSDFDVLQVINGAYDIVGSNVKQAGGDYKVTQFPGKSLSFKEAGFTQANPPPGMYPKCPSGKVYNYVQRQCMGCEGARIFVEAVGKCLCKTGYHANGTFCEPCEEGTYSATPGSLKCSRCVQGFYQQLQGQTKCERCPKGTFRTRGDVSQGDVNCTVCDKGQTTLESGSDSSDLCLCPEQTFMRAESGGCTKCPEGLTCPAGLGPPLQQPGFFAEIHDEAMREYSVWTCRDKSECNVADLGRCPAGRQSRACSNCMDAHKKLDDGTCQQCGDSDSIPTVIILILAACAAMAGLVLVNTDLQQQSLSFLTVAIVASQLCMVLQTFGSFRQLSVRWVEPIKSILALTNILTFDLDVVNISCVMASDNPVTKFVIKLFAYPIILCFLMIAWSISKLTPRPQSLDNVFNLNGLLIYVLFITLTLTVLLPFQCKSNPSGLGSMVSNPDLACFQDDEHYALVGLGVVGIFAYPVLILSWIGWTTWKYPTRVASGQGLQMVQRYRFLFNRFKRERYYYGLVLLVRNGLISLLPILLVSLEALQLVAMGALLVCSTVALALLHPWRTVAANFADIAMTSFMVIMMIGAAPLLQLDIASSEGVVGGLLCFAALAPLALGIGCAVYGAYRRFVPAEVFGVFLCHHKGGAGALARLLKTDMSAVTNSNVFLDSDQLEDLDLIFDTVRTGTKNLAILLTSEVLKRMWCAGEITTAHVNKIPIIPIVCDDFMPLTDASIESIPDVWTQQQKHTLSTFGISMESIKAAYYCVKDLPGLTLKRFEGTDHRKGIVQSLVTMGKLAQKGVSGLNKVTRPRILVTGAVADAEALAAIQIFQVLCQQHMQVESSEVMSAKQMSETKPYASYLVVLFSRGMLRDPEFARLLLVAMSDNDASKGVEGVKSQSSMLSTSSAASAMRILELVTVSADTGFEFPSLDFLTDLEKNGLAAPGLGPKTGPQLSKAYRSLLSVLALPMAPHGSAGLLGLQVSEICRRFRRYKNSAEGFALDKEADAHVQEVNIMDIIDLEEESGAKKPKDELLSAVTGTFNSEREGEDEETLEDVF